VGPELEEDGEPAVVVSGAAARDVGDDPLHAGGDPVRRDDLLDSRAVALDAALVDGEEQRFFRGEVRVDGALRVAGGIGDRAEGGGVRRSC
jgi:hypothetical protein